MRKVSSANKKLKSMKNIITILIVLLSINTIIAQHTITSQILDAKTKEPLSFVNIGIENSNSGTVSNDEGKFELQVKTKEDVLVFSYIGYHSKKIASGSISENALVLLEPDSYVFDVIEVTSTNFDNELILGAKNKNGRGKSIGFGNPQLGTELGALIRIKKETLIKSVNFVLNHAKGDSLLFRVNIYNYKNKVIGEKILKHNIYFKDKQRKGEFSINLEEYDIILNNDVLLSLEWLQDFDEAGNKLITFDTKKSRKLGGTFIRSTKTGKFRKLPVKRKLKPCIFFIGKQKSN